MGSTDFLSKLASLKNGLSTVPLPTGIPYPRLFQNIVSVQQHKVNDFWSWNQSAHHSEFLTETGRLFNSNGYSTVTSQNGSITRSLSRLQRGLRHRKKQSSIIICCSDDLLNFLELSSQWNSACHGGWKALQPKAFPTGAPNVPFCSLCYVLLT